MPQGRETAVSVKHRDYSPFPTLAVFNDSAGLFDNRKVLIVAIEQLNHIVLYPDPRLELFFC